jgi:CPA1 family monovalent cation:H+ antiporter
MNDTHFAINIFILLLLIASGVAMAAKWVRVPYTLLLVIVGLVISPMHFIPVVHISPDLILLIFLPALLFEAAWNLKLDHLRENLLPILMLAVFGVCLSVGVIAAILHFGIGMSWQAALLFGAMISATDPVSVLTIFKKMNLPSRLSIIVEGESLFNDGTAVVVFRIILGIIISGTDHSFGGLALASLREFGVVVFGGLAVGAIIGIVASTLTSYFDDHLLEITLTTIAAYGSFLLAEAFHVSPVIAVLLAGLVLGNFGRRKGMSPTTQVAVNSFWEYAAFVVNSLVFLLIGLEIQLSALLDDAVYVVWAILAMLVSRAVAVYAIMPLTNRFTHSVPLRWQHVLFWGGLRGSLSMALALSLPSAFPSRALLIAMIFGTVIFSLLAQGLTIAPLLKLLKFTQAEPERKEYEILQGKLLADTAALAELKRLQTRGAITDHVFNTLQTSLSASYQDAGERLAKLTASGRVPEQEQIHRIQQHLLDVKKNRIVELFREGVLSDSAHRELSEQYDSDRADEMNEQRAQETASESSKSL